MALLLREALGETLRRARVAQNRTLRDVSTLARVSLGYLSEVERGRKEASSELLAAICEALDVPLADVLFEAGESIADAAPAPAESAKTAAEPASATAVMSAASASGAPRIAEDTRIVIPAPARPYAAA
jgi:transcriptional regulator with XRE-family HTH domain